MHHQSLVNCTENTQDCVAKSNARGACSRRGGFEVPSEPPQAPQLLLTDPCGGTRRMHTCRRGSLVIQGRVTLYAQACAPPQLHSSRVSHSPDMSQTEVVCGCREPISVQHNLRVQLGLFPEPTLLPAKSIARHSTEAPPPMVEGPQPWLQPKARLYVMVGGVTSHQTALRRR